MSLRNCTLRLEFHSRVQKPNESVLEYIAVLQQLASKCNFGVSHDGNLGDQLIRGIKGDEVRRKLLRTDNLNYSKAKSIVVQDEAVRRQSQAIANSVAVRAVSYRRPAQQRKQQRGPKPQPGPERRQQQQSYQSNTGTNASSSSSTRNGPCFRCGRRHDPKTCPARNWHCYKCNRKGHVKSLCPSVYQNLIDKEKLNLKMINFMYLQKRN